MPIREIGPRLTGRQIIGNVTPPNSAAPLVERIVDSRKCQQSAYLASVLALVRRYMKATTRHLSAGDQQRKTLHLRASNQTTHGSRRRSYVSRRVRLSTEPCQRIDVSSSHTSLPIRSFRLPQIPQNSLANRSFDLEQLWTNMPIVGSVTRAICSRLRSGRSVPAHPSRGCRQARRFGGSSECERRSTLT
jgi:hypothetical protein